MIYFLLNAFEGDTFLLLCFRISYIFYFMLQKGINLLQKVTYFLQHALRFLLNYFRYDCNPHILGTLDYCVHFMSRTPTIPEEKVTFQTIENMFLVKASYRHFFSRLHKFFLKFNFFFFFK